MRRRLVILGGAAAIAAGSVGVVAGVDSLSDDGGGPQLPRIPGKAIDVKAATTCVPGYSKRARPKSSYTTALKKRQLEQWQLPGEPQEYEEDHLIPLSIGGDPRSPENLWPEPRAQAAVSNPLEFELYGRVCQQGLSLEEAQRQIVEFKQKNG